MKNFKLLLVFLMACFTKTAIAQLHFDGGVLTMTGGSTLSVEGDITRTTGGIASDGSNNKLVWKIGNTTTAKVAPFISATGTYIPVTIQLAAGGSSDGSVELNTYAGSTWNNDTYKPPTVTNVNHNGANNSDKLVDRFWLADLTGYATKPGVASLQFTYQQTEVDAVGNTIVEAALITQRWNNTTNKWDDYFPTSAANAAANTITATNIPAAQMKAWWAGVDGNRVLPVTLVYFKATNRSADVLAEWQTSSEINTKNFELQRGQNANQFDGIATVTAKGNSTTTSDYDYADGNPLVGTSFYRLKIVDKDGSFTYSNVVPITRNAANTIVMYPNPSFDVVNVRVAQDMVTTNALIQIYDTKGRLMKTARVVNTITSIPIAELASGQYLVRIISGETAETFKLIKK